MTQFFLPPASGGGSGPPGAAATIEVGQTTTGQPGTNASVTNSGNSSNAIFDFTIPQGANGTNGTPGQPGAAATIAVGQTTTGEPGTDAQVLNVGTPEAAVLDFTIPQGASGAPATPATVNLLTNGGFEIWQRGNGPFTTTHSFTADRWMIFLDTSSTISVTRFQTFSGLNTTPSWGIEAVYTQGTGATSAIAQQLRTSEYPNLKGVPLSLSARVFSTVPNSARIFLASDGTNPVQAYSSFHPGNSTWQTLTVTFLSATDAASISANLSLEASCTAYVDNAMLVVGSTPAEYVPLHPQEDLARCQRYYEIMDGLVVRAMGYMSPTSSIQTGFPFRVEKAVIPTVTLPAAGVWVLTNLHVPQVIGGGPNTRGMLMQWASGGAAGDGSAWFPSPNVVTIESNP